MFDCIEMFYNPQRKHVGNGMLSPAHFEQSMSVNGRAPKLAVVVVVDEVFMHCAKAFRRSHLWNPDHFQDRTEMPSLVKIILDETTGAPSDEDEMHKMDDDLESECTRTLY